MLFIFVDLSQQRKFFDGELFQNYGIHENAWLVDEEVSELGTNNPQNFGRCMKLLS